MKKKSALFILLLVIVIASLLIAYWMGGRREFSSQTVAISMGLMVFALALADVYIASRPRFFEESIGLPPLYRMHGILAVVLIVAAAVHVIMELYLTRERDFRLVTAGAG